jgi:hypothetical protein
VRVWKCFELDSSKMICYMQLLVYALQPSATANARADVLDVEISK